LEGRRIGVLNRRGSGERFSYGEALDDTLQEALDEMADSGAEQIDVALPGEVDSVVSEFLYEFPPPWRTNSPSSRPRLIGGGSWADPDYQRFATPSR